MQDFSSILRKEKHGDHFPETHWSLVLKAIDQGSSQGRDALGRLYLIYRYPLYAFIRRNGHSATDAEDLLQLFFARIVEGRHLANLRSEGGKFRSFLLTVLRNFLANERERERTLKRGAGCELLSLDLVDAEGRYQIEPSDPITPEVLFDQRWATALLTHVFQRLRQEYVSGQKADLFDELSEFLAGKSHGNEYAAIASRLRVSEDVVKVGVHRMRKRYGKILREEVARTVSRPEEIDAEIRHLIAAARGNTAD